MKKAILLAVLFLVFISFQDVEAQCAMCKASATSAQDTGNTAANGLNSGILYLMGIPYVLLLFFFRKHVKNLFGEILALYKR